MDFNLDKPLPPIDETRLCEEDLLALDLVDSSVKQRFSSHKKLFGVDGWLGDLRDEPVQKLKFKTFRDLGKKIKDHVEEIVSSFSPSEVLSHTYIERRLEMSGITRSSSTFTTTLSA